jgi:hypothetical protein
MVEKKQKQMKKKKKKQKSSDLWRLIREQKCKLADCDIKDSCLLRGLPELCSRWLNKEEYYEIGEDWRDSTVAKLVRPIGVTETGWLYYCEGCGTTFEMVREIHIPWCIDCRVMNIMRLKDGESVFDVQPRSSRRNDGSRSSYPSTSENTRGGGVGGVEGEGEGR